MLWEVLLRMNNDSYHIPVLLHAAVDGLVLNKSGTYVDVTFGGGGHSKEILSRLSKDAKLIAFDQDEDAVDNAVENLSSLLEPLIMAILGVLIGGLMIAMYLPIFLLGSVI